MKKTIKVVAALPIIFGSITFALAQSSGEISGPPWFQKFAHEVKATFDSINTKLRGFDTQITQNTAAITSIKETLAPFGKTYDYRDYEGADVSSRTFNTVGAGICGTTEVQTFIRTPQPDGSTQVREFRDRRNNVTCQFDVLDFRATDSAFFITGRETRSAVNPNVITDASVLDTPIPQLTTAMRIGSSWGSGAKTTLTNTANGAVNIAFFTLVGTLLAAEGVTVPAGTFNDCLKISEVRNSGHFANNTQISWYCRDTGLVKRIVQFTSSGIGFELDLQSFTR